MCAVQLCSEAIQPNLKLKTWARQLLGSLLLNIALPGVFIVMLCMVMKSNMMLWGL